MLLCILGNAMNSNVKPFQFKAESVRIVQNSEIIQT